MRRMVACRDENGNISVEEEETPAVGDHEVLVEVHASLISPGTELGGIKKMREQGKRQASGSKTPFGYSNAGMVVESGKQCQRFEKGAEVACMGAGMALHANYAVMPQNLCIAIPDAVSFEEAAFAHLSATSLNAVRRAALQFGENVLVMGLGIIGNIAGQLARASGCHVLGVDFFRLRRDLALGVGFDAVVDPEKEDLIEVCRQFTRSYGIDCAFICFGGDATEAYNQLLQVMKTTPDTHVMGRVVIPGGCQITLRAGASLGNMDVRGAARTGPGYHDPEYEKGRDYPAVFVQWTTQRNLEEMLRAIAEKRISVEKLITHRFPLTQAPEACELLISQPDQALGVILQPREKEQKK